MHPRKNENWWNWANKWCLGGEGRVTPWI
jgi:hypothetical protein